MMFSLLARSLTQAVAMLGTSSNLADPLERLIAVFGLRVALAFSVYAAIITLR